MNKCEFEKHNEPITNNKFRFFGSLHGIHWLILSLSLVLTLFAWYFSTEQVNEKINNRFQNESQRVIDLIIERMELYENALWAGVATIDIFNGDISYQNWKIYVNNLNLLKKYPGINGIGVIYHVPPSHLKHYLAKQRKERPTFFIYPPHKEKRYLPITYIQPIKGNEKAVGLDMAHEKNRYTAAIKAEETGRSQITGPIVLVQDKEKTPGFLFYVPFYTDGNHKTVKARKTHFKGLVYAPFIFKKLMDGTLAQQNRQINIKISDNGDTLYNELTQKENLQFNTLPFKRTVKVNVYGRMWIFSIVGAPVFHEATMSTQPLTILIGGIIIDLLLLMLFINITQTNKRAITHARKMTKELKEKSKQLIELALTDTLTNLPNRKHFLDHLPKALERAKRYQRLLAVLFIDLDNFKQINDSFGHEFGDELLQVVSERLLELTRSAEFIARLGGDEFLIVVENEKQITQITDMAQHIVHSFKESAFILNDKSLHVLLSIGIAIYPMAGDTAEALLRHADIAMYRAKAKGQQHYELFNDTINQEIQRHHRIEMAMHDAIEKAAFTLKYQPQFSIKTHKIIGIEALIRWPSETLGNPMPDEFIKIAEMNQMIVPLGKWILEKAILDYQILVETTDHELKELAINISAVQLMNNQFYDDCKQLIEKYPFIKNVLVLEITETSLLTNLEHVNDMLNKLHRLKVRFALDDFGMGHASLHYLKHLPIAILKIDQSFVRDIDVDESDMTIIKLIISLAQHFHLTTIAEGVESLQQLTFLKEHGCDIAQGYYFAKPLELEALIELINKYD